MISNCKSRNSIYNPIKTDMKRFLSFLGTGDYKPCRYRLNDQTSQTVVYVQTATNLFADPHCDEAVVFCTAKAQEKHETGLLAEFSANGLPGPRIVPIPDGASEEQLWEIFRVVRDVVGDGDEIVFDVTHSFRSLPVVMTVLLRYLAAVKKTTIGACLYGAWEARDEEKNVAPVFDLTPFFALDDWTHAIRSFEEYGDPLALRGLAAEKLGPLCGHDAAARTLNEAVRKMAAFATNIRLSNLGTVDGKFGVLSMKLRSDIAEPLSRRGVSAAVPVLEPVLERAAGTFSAFDDHEIRNGFRAARWAAAHGLLPQACTLLQETVVSIVCEQNSVICEQYRDLRPKKKTFREVRVFVSNVLGSAGEPKKLADWKPPVESDVALALANALPPGFTAPWDRLKKIRNSVNHAGTNPEEPVRPDASDYRPDTLFKLADALENALYPDSK